MAKPSLPEHLKHTYIGLQAGGVGTRLWPRSRKATPKQFTSIFKGETLFQQTVGRFDGFLPANQIYVITNKRYVPIVEKQAPSFPEDNIIAEPLKKDTAIAIGIAAALVYHRDPHGVVINIATDHKINNLDLYYKTLSVAAQTAYEKNKIVTIGIKPTFPHTGMGHIERGKKLYSAQSTSVFDVKSFVEKPDLKTAKRFNATGRYYWNSNKFVFPAKLMLDEFARYAPDMFKLLEKFSKAIGTHRQNKVLKEVYQATPAIAIDYVIAEKSDQLVLVEGKFGWSDIGDWRVVYDMSPKNKQGNVVIKHGNEGDHYELDTESSLIHYDDQLIATIGVQDLIVVDTDDALLICHKDRAQDVKKLVNYLKENKLSKFL